MSLRNFESKRKRNELEKIGMDYYYNKKLIGNTRNIELYNHYKMSSGYSNESCDGFYEFQGSQIRKIISGGGPLIIATDRQYIL